MDVLLTNQRTEKTRPKKSTIGERRKPQPNGKPGYIRIDTVHQGDRDVVPWVTYTDPELARVGLTEQQAIEKGIAPTVLRFDFFIGVR